MTHFRHLLLPGGLFGIWYRFDKRGEGIPMHEHAEALEHSVECTRGRVLIYGPEFTDAHEIATDETYVFDSRAPHEIVALEDGSCIFNLFTHGQPPEYAQLPPEELTGALDLALTHKLPD
jgi:hypothetical protein